MHKVKITAILLSLLLFAGNFLAAQNTQEARLEDIDFQKANQEIKVFIQFSERISYDSFSLMNPNRLVLDFFGIQAVSSPSMIEINELGIVSIRSALNRPGVARVVFNFTDEIPHYQMKETETGLTVIFSKEAKTEEMVTEEKKEPEEKIRKEVPPVKKEPPKIQQQEKERERPQESVKKMGLGFSSGYSAFQDSVFKETYGEGGVFFKIEYSFILPIDVKSIDIWTSFNYFKKTGETTFTKEDLELRITTFSLAVRYLKKMSKFTPFAGAGIDYIVYKEMLPEEFTVGSVSGSDTGFHIQGGTYFDILPSLSLKAHIKYVWSKTTKGEITVNLGGIEYGLGLVFRFNL